MSATLVFWAGFREGGALLDSVDLVGADIPELVVRRIALSDGTFSTPLASTDMSFDSTSGLWYYRLTGCDLTAYDYVGYASTSYADADAVDQWVVPYVSPERYETELDRLDAAVSTRATAGAAMDLVAGAVDAAAISTDAIDADALASDAINEIADQVWEELLAGHSAIAGSAAAYLAAAGAAGDPWAAAVRTLTQSAAQVHDAIDGDEITITTHARWLATFDSLGNITGYQKIWFTVKDDPASTDSESLVQIELTAGLLYIQKAAGVAGNGSITVDDAAAGTITVIIEAPATAKLTTIQDGLHYDIKWLDGSGNVDQLSSGDGKATIVRGITRATS